MARQTFVLAALILATITSATKTVPLKLTDKHPKRCLNLGSWFKDAGPFEAELGFVKYGREPKILKPTSKGPIARTPFQKAFRVQRTAKHIRFSVSVSHRYCYTVTTAHAEIVDKYCRKRTRALKIYVNGRKREINVAKAVGCKTAAFLTFKNIKPIKEGLIIVRVRGIEGLASIAGICIARKSCSAPSPKPRPSKSPRPRPSKSPRPRPSKSSSPAPSESKSPAPSESSSPAPSESSSPAPSEFNSPAPSASNSPAPSQSSSPIPSPSTSPKPPFGPGPCEQAGCMNFEGHGDYVVIGNSMSNSEDRTDCSIKHKSSEWVTLPHGAVVRKAILYWSASGHITKDATVDLNGHHLTASKTYHGGSNGYFFYGAEVEVTDLVKGVIDFHVSGIWYDNGGLLCQGNAAYAAWSLVMVYELNTLPRARINVCTDNFKFTFPAGQYSSSVECIAGTHTTVKAKTTVVTFESDNYKGEHFFINGNYIGDNEFRGRTAPNLDIVEYDITGVVKTLVTKITYTVKSYFVHTVFGGAIEGLFMPVRVVYHTVDH